MPLHTRPNEFQQQESISLLPSHLPIRYKSLFSQEPSVELMFSQLIPSWRSTCFHQLFNLLSVMLSLSQLLHFSPLSPLPATHHHSLLLALNIKQNPFPPDSRTNPFELLLISVRASLFDSLQMSLNPF